MEIIQGAYDYIKKSKILVDFNFVKQAVTKLIAKLFIRNIKQPIVVTKTPEKQF